MLLGIIIELELKELETLILLVFLIQLHMSNIFLQVIPYIEKHEKLK